MALPCACEARPCGWPFPPSLCEVGLYEHSGCGGIFQVSVWSPPPVCDRPSGLVTPRECLRLSACVLIRSWGVSPFLAPSLFADCGAPGGFGRCTPSRPILIWPFLGRWGWRASQVSRPGSGRRVVASTRLLGPGASSSGRWWRGPALRTRPLPFMRPHASFPLVCRLDLAQSHIAAALSLPRRVASFTLRHGNFLSRWPLWLLKLVR